MTRHSPLLLALALPLAGCTDQGITVVNANPEAEILAPAEGTAFRIGENLPLRGSASDRDQALAELAVRWYVGDARVCPDEVPDDQGLTLCDTEVPGGESAAIRLEVIDFAGATAVDERSIVITPDLPPEVAITEPAAETTAYAGSLVRFRAEVSDAEEAAEALTVRWVSSRDGDLGTVTPTSAGIAEGYYALTEGQHAIQAFVKDSLGNESVASVLLTVGPPNRTPSCDLVAPDDDSASAFAQNVDFEAEVADPDIAANRLQVEWSSDKDGVLGTSVPDSDGGVFFTFDELSVASHRITLRVTDDIGATCTDSVGLTVGNPPSVDLETPLDDEVVNAGASLAFVATANDSEDAAAELIVRWESNRDGLLYEGPPDSRGVSQFFADDLTVGTHRLTVRVTDRDGLYATALGTFRINGLPGAPTLSLTPAAPLTADDLRVRVDTEAVDPESEATTYVFRWLRDGVPSTASTDATLPASATQRGETWRVEVAARDPYGTGAFANASVTIGDTAPTLTGVALTPVDPTESTTLTCGLGALADADDDTVGVHYDWSVNGTALALDSATLDGSSFGREDVVRCSATPTDGTLDGTPRTSATVTIGNSPPAMASAQISPSAPKFGDTVTCAASGYADPDGDANASTFAWTVNGVAAGTGTELSTGFKGGDTVRCTAIPFDGASAGTAVSASVVVANTPPTLVSANLGPANPTKASTLTCAAGASSDVDGQTVTFDYAWRINGDTISATAATFAAASLAVGDTVACVVTPKDGVGSGTPVASNSVTIQNTLPSLTGPSINSTTGRVGDTLTCTASSSDIDGDTPAITYAWSNGATGNTTVLTASDDPGTSITCTATAVDANGGSRSGYASATVLNSKPVLSAVSVTPNPAYNDSTLTCSATVSDADGGTPTLHYVWTDDTTGTELGSDSATLALAGTGRTPGSHVVCTVSANDPNGGTASASTTRLLTNRPPTASVTLTPAAPVRNSTLTCTGSSSDADGDTRTFAFEWAIAGSPVPATSSGGLTSTLAGPFTAEQTVSCTFTSMDPSGASSSGTATVTIGNTTPTVGDVMLSPTTVYTKNTLTVAASVSDADGDATTTTYQWYVNSVLKQSGPGTTFSGIDHFGKGDVVYVVATASDGERIATATSSSLTVANTTPTTPSVAISPTTPSAGQALTCHLTSESSDDDLDPLTYRFGWMRDGVAYTDFSSLPTSSGVPASAVTGGAVWHCTADAYDGAGYSPAGTASKTIVNCGNGAETLVAGGIGFVTVCAQTFDMGCTPGQTPCATTQPPISVTLTNNYYVSRHEITRQEYNEVMGWSPVYTIPCEGTCPAAEVNWEQAAAFANKLSTNAGLQECYPCVGKTPPYSYSSTCTELEALYSCNGYRLLTEAEWEGAARCKEDLRYAGSATVAAVGWIDTTTPDPAQPQPVGLKAPNRCGLYDMTGNVMEWVHDRYEATYLTASPATNPTGPWADPANRLRVIRGGGYQSNWEVSGVSFRVHADAWVVSPSLGFRIARTTP